MLPRESIKTMGWVSQLRGSQARAGNAHVNAQSKCSFDHQIMHMHMLPLKSFNATIILQLKLYRKG